MFQWIALYVIILLAAVTIVTGAVCHLRGSHLSDLRTRTRNFMYVGACCAMCLGFIGATACLGALMKTPLHYAGATILSVVGVIATIHLFADLSDRLRILKRA